jgi:hypothetical protein
MLLPRPTVPPVEMSHNPHKALDRRIERQIAGRTADLLGRRTIIFGIAPCEQHTGTTGGLELGLQGNIAGETQSPTALAGCGKIRLSFRTGAALLGRTRNPGTQAKPLFLKPVFLGPGFPRCAPAPE